MKSMPNHLPDSIVARITELIESRGLPKKERNASLKAAANEAWNILFPEDTNPSASRLPPDTRMGRWNEVKEQLSANPHRDKIIRIVESSASGERFHWLD